MEGAIATSRSTTSLVSQGDIQHMGSTANDKSELCLRLSHSVSILGGHSSSLMERTQPQEISPVQKGAADGHPPAKGFQSLSPKDLSGQDVNGGLSRGRGAPMYPVVVEDKEAPVPKVQNQPSKQHNGN